MDETTWKAGLEDVVAARSSITSIDGNAGRLQYRGYEIGDLVERTTFEEVTHLLWFGELPDAAEASASAPVASPFRRAAACPTPRTSFISSRGASRHPRSRECST